MNLVLFDRSEIERPLARTDARARHILEVLRRQPGEGFDVGIVGGQRGKAVLNSVGVDSLVLSFSWSEAALPPDPIVLVVGLTRPQIARKILRDAPGLGLQALHFFRPEKGERSYGDSSLWTTGEWRTQLSDGAAQAFDTRLPEVSAGSNLAEILDAQGAGVRIALDPYESKELLSTVTLSGVSESQPALLALGPERGWSAEERDLLRRKGFILASLGKRILRTETACAAAVAVLKAQLGLF